ncbi:MAG TPA: helicase-exonuclease AddAB subunit AddA, partial [Bacilli bacterium]
LLKQALKLSYLPGGPIPYIDNLQGDLVLVEYLLEVTQNHSWEHLYHAFQASGFGRLNPCKADEVDKELQEQVKELRDQAKKQLNQLKDELFQRPPEAYLAEIHEMAPVMKTLVEAVIEFGEQYKQAKKEKGLVDFADLEHYCLQILRHPDSTPEELKPSLAALDYQHQFSEVLLDEYQDTNKVQEAIVALISRQNPGNRFMVGDVKQSIYRFRLADPGLFLEKYKTYSPSPSRTIGYETNEETGAGLETGTTMPASGLNGLSIDLAQNFRSRSAIVDGVNYIFKQVMNEKVAEIAYDQRAELVLGADYPYGDKTAEDFAIEVMLVDRTVTESEDGSGDPGYAADDSDANENEEVNGGSEPSIQQEIREMVTAQLEARLIAMQIKQMMGEGGHTSFEVYDRKTGGVRPVSYRDIVVLLRATKQWAPTIMDELRLAAIPAYADLNTGYFTATEVEIIISLLKIIDNPFQDIPLAAVLRSPICRLSAEDLAQIRLAGRNKPFFEALLAYSSLTDGADPILHNKILPFLTQLELWRNEARQGSLADLIWRVYRETSFYDLVGGMPGGIQRQANLRALYDRARQYEATSFRGLFRFLRFIERMQDSGGDLGTARAIGEQEDVVRIMSIHKSKGLEFPVVFIAGLGKIFNNQDLKGSFLLHKQLGFGPKFVDAQLRLSYPALPNLAVKRRMRLETLAEEMRILYVALTRPKEKLFLVGTVKNMDKQLQNWAQHLDHAEWYFPDYALAKARGFLDWIGPALIRHPQALKLRERGRIHGRIPEFMRDEPSLWRISLIPQDHLVQAAASQETVDAGKLGAIRQSQPLEGIAPEYESEISARLAWQYPYEEATTYFSKTTVSEMKRMMDIKHRNLEFAFARKSVFRRPRHMGQQRMSPAERGTIYHTLMQYIPLEPGLSEENIIQAMAGMIESQLVTHEQMVVIDISVINAFFGSELGQRVLNSKMVRREIPFSYGLTVGEVYPHEIPHANDAARQGTNAVASEKVLIQGVIDCVFEENDSLILLDYKTDAVHGDPVVVSERYRLQIDLYAKAIENIWKRPVAEKYLFFLDGSHLVRM